MILVDILFWIVCAIWFNKTAFVDTSPGAIVGTIGFTIVSTLFIIRYVLLLVKRSV